MLEEKKKKSIVWIIVPIVILVIGIYFFWNKKPHLRGMIGKFVPTNQKESLQGDEKEVPSLPEIKNSSEKKINNNAIEIQDSFEEENSFEGMKKSDELADEKLRGEIMKYVEENLNSLAPPPKNDKWDSPSIAFVGNSHFYLFLTALETDLAGLEILYESKKEGNGFKLTEIARYKEGEETWDLVSGEDIYGDYETEDYTFNEDKKVWEKDEDVFEEEGWVDNSEDDEESDLEENDSDQKTIMP